MDTDPLLLLHVAEDTDHHLLLPVLTLADTDRLPLLLTIPAEDIETDIMVTDRHPLPIVAAAVLPLSVRLLS